MLGKSPIKWRQRPDMPFAVDWDIKHKLKQTKIIMHVLHMCIVLDSSCFGFKNSSRSALNGWFQKKYCVLQFCSELFFLEIVIFTELSNYHIALT